MSRVTQFKKGPGKGASSKGSSIQINRSQNPFLSLQNEVDRLFNDFTEFFSPTKFNWGQFEKMDLSPSMDIVEDQEHFCVQLEMPGMDEKDIKVSISDNILTISGEKSVSKKNEGKRYLSREISFGKYERSISLPSTVDLNNAKATFKKGMLWVELPKKAESKTGIRDIKVEQTK
ncbi:Hsp20/alpha crystallin family protein [Fluoribacter dumoffii]|uniref:Spore protein SP21 n=1 Tax=Fluoribacter dumoffii TaxID=463 RepID=A0A377G756_9GAMM|nr:Hsp20/alpha crystallin family protein [Fluoribacter dumoffii]KTC89542.1 heat shock protein [Fluoribacter dumoffii NY 23]MCW8384735.1 Hsp20/alpha crystallin family protein [Fluoribacter dumoffii]MCW8417798.1 Hsp20/alpha crystallin family protein [Fluoribacter dumoffii]MCW8454360.1 Hsp20/alpha crystallin family protein [Fluoribacter dumoffii]MCW8461566.1 Hsp20/alpha crystallin family protein [Fluoribacter dumoffii]